MISALKPGPGSDLLNGYGGADDDSEELEELHEVSVSMLGDGIRFREENMERGCGASLIPALTSLFVYLLCGELAGVWDGEGWKSEEWKVAAMLAVVLQSVALSAVWFCLLSLAGDAGV